MLIEYLNVWGINPWLMGLILISSGFIVGFINTIAGSGTVITYSIYLSLGLPPPVASGTLRVGVFFQTITSTVVFYKNKKLDLKKAIIYGLIVSVGSVIGALITVQISSSLFNKIVGLVILALLPVMLLDPSKWQKRKAKDKKPKIWHYFLLLFFGFYGGFIHIGVGFFFLFMLMFFMGYDIVEANAMKSAIVLIYTVCVLTVFLATGEIAPLLGLIVGFGNILGGILGTNFTLKSGTKSLQKVLMFFMFIFGMHLLGVWSLLYSLIA